MQFAFSQENCEETLKMMTSVISVTWRDKIREDDLYDIDRREVYSPYSICSWRAYKEHKPVKRCRCYDIEISYMHLHD
jgi:hypothetical protein